jgi:hypothetical protein
MKLLIIHVPFLPATGMALFPFILVKDVRVKKDKQIINHEQIHLRQQLELLIVPFYMLYLLNYLINLIVYRNHHLAYLNIVFEREAYRKDADLDYLKHRKLWAWANFF